LVGTVVVDPLLFESLFCGVGLGLLGALAVEFLAVDARDWTV
jgi:hypothetical protein